MFYNTSVAALRKFVGFVIALVVLSVPVLACALPGQEMSAEEQSCCLHMADECNGSQMESHSCCNKLPQIGAGVFQASHKYAPASLDHAVQIAFDLLPKTVTMITAVPHVIAQPESPPGQPSVLRI